MGPRAFPFPINIGTDICQVSRIYRLLAGDRGTRFLQRVFTQDERALVPSLNGKRQSLDTFQNNDFEALKKHDPSLWKTAAHVAGRFAAKEAAFKAHPFRRLSFHDITIVRRGTLEDRKDVNGSGPPVAVIRGEREGEPGQIAQVSISHDGDYATAVCLAYEPPAEGKETKKSDP